MDSTFWPFGFLGFFWLWYCFLRPLRCPDCSAELSRVVAPQTKTREQWIEGFAVCPHCGTEFYDNGKVRVAPMTRHEILKLWTPFFVAMLLAVSMQGYYRWHLHRHRVMLPPVSAPAAVPAQPAMPVPPAIPVAPLEVSHQSSLPAVTEPAVT